MCIKLYILSCLGQALLCNVALLYLCFFLFQMTYSLAVLVSNPVAMGNTVASIPLEGIVPGKPSGIHSRTFCYFLIFTSCQRCHQVIILVYQICDLFHFNFLFLNRWYFSIFQDYFSFLCLSIVYFFNILHGLCNNYV